MVTIYFIRHGESVGNKENRFRGRFDFELNENGIRQAEALRDELSDVKFSAIYSSPLSRAEKTARIIARDQVGISCCEELTNIHLGSWENQPKALIREQYPQLWQTWLTSPEDLSFEGMESFAQVQKRAYDFILQLLPQHSGQIIAVVSHRAVLKPLFAAILELPGRYFWKFDIDTAAYSIVEYRTERGFTFTNLNQNKHLVNFIREDLG